MILGILIFIFTSHFRVHRHRTGTILSTQHIFMRVNTTETDLVSFRFARQIKNISKKTVPTLTNTLNIFLLEQL